MKRMLLGLGLLAAAQAGCVHGGASVYASSDYYGPPADGPAGAYQQPASAAYGVPANAPKGTVYIVSLGGEQLPAGNVSALFMHVRIAAENTSDTVAWRLDPNEQVLRLEGGAQVPASFAEASGATASGIPVLALAAGQRGQLDLYYPLPAQGGPQRTTLEWRVQRGSEPVANATVLERPQGSTAQGPVYYEPRYDTRFHLAVGPGWWWGYDYWPFYYGYYWPSYRPWYGGYWGSHRYGYYAPRGGYYRSPGSSYGRGYAPRAPAGHGGGGVGRGGFRRR
jgi:hypothetical protein